MKSSDFNSTRVVPSRYGVLSGSTQQPLRGQRQALLEYGWPGVITAEALHLVPFIGFGGHAFDVSRKRTQKGAGPALPHAIADLWLKDLTRR